MDLQKTFRITIDNSEHFVTVKRKNKTTLDITVDGTLYSVNVEQEEEICASSDTMNTLSLTPSQSSNYRSNNTDTVIRAPIPGKVIKVFVNVGDIVKNGQVLLQLEAMKMSNDIISSCSGKIVKIISSGVNVSYKDELVSIDTNARIDDSNE